MLVGMFLTVIPVVGVVMDGFILLMDVGVRVAMLMVMGVCMGMFMGMLQADGVFHHQNSCSV